MRVLVYPALMEIGGSQLNAIELAEQVQRAGHEVVLFAPAGELNDVAEQRGLEIVRSPSTGLPRAQTVAALNRLVTQRQIDVVHAYEWSPAVELGLGPYARHGTPLLTTVMSMDVPDLIPVRSPMVVGTAELAEQQRGHRTTTLIEPWIDTEANRPGAAGGPAARNGFGLDTTDVVAVVVCRMTTDLGKAAGVLAAMETVAQHNARPDRVGRLRLLVVGDGDQLPTIRARAAELGDDTVAVGPLIDPRAAYDCAVVVLGMGSSALKGLSYGKPLVVQGQNGFWQVFDPRTREVFEHQGFFGHGTASSTAESADVLTRELDRLISTSTTDLAELGRFGRDFVLERFSLDAATRTHLAIYDQLVAAPPSPADRLATFVRTGRELAKLRLARAYHDLRERRPDKVTT